MTKFLQCLLCSLILVAVASVEGGQTSIQNGYKELNLEFPNLIGKNVEEATTEIRLELPGVKLYVVMPGGLVHSLMAPDFNRVGDLVGMPYEEAIEKILEKVPGIKIIVKNSAGTQIDSRESSNLDPNHILMNVDDSSNVAKKPVYMMVEEN